MPDIQKASEGQQVEKQNSDGYDLGLLGTQLKARAQTLISALLSGLTREERLSVSHRKAFGCSWEVFQPLTPRTILWLCNHYLIYSFQVLNEVSISAFIFKNEEMKSRRWLAIRLSHKVHQ